MRFKLYATSLNFLRYTNTYVHPIAIMKMKYISNIPQIKTFVELFKVYLLEKKENKYAWQNFKCSRSLRICINL